MRITFEGDGRRIPLDLPMLKIEDDQAVMDWVQNNKSTVEAISNGTQLVRAVYEVLAPKD